MVTRSGQSAMEFLIILGVILVFIGFITEIAFQLNRMGYQARNIVQANQFVHVVANIINEIYIAGNGTTKTVDFSEIVTKTDVNVTTGDGAVIVIVGEAVSDRSVIPATITSANFNATEITFTNDGGAITIEIVS